MGFNPALDGDKDISLILFWTMVEAGTAIIAACLPTLRALTGKHILEDFLRSVKSTFSLSSKTSGVSFPLSSASRSHHNGGSSVEHITWPEFPETTNTFESYAMHDIETVRPSNKGEIKVEKTFHQELSPA